jgi:hypothetical protein
MVNEKGLHLLSIKHSHWVLCTVMQSPPLPPAVQNSHQNANTAGKLGDTNRYFYQSLLCSNWSNATIPKSDFNFHAYPLSHVEVNGGSCTATFSGIEAKMLNLSSALEMHRNSSITFYWIWNVKWIVMYHISMNVHAHGVFCKLDLNWQLLPHL